MNHSPLVGHSLELIQVKEDRKKNVLPSGVMEGLPL